MREQVVGAAQEEIAGDAPEPRDRLILGLGGLEIILVEALEDLLELLVLLVVEAGEHVVELGILGGDGGHRQGPAQKGDQEPRTQGSPQRGQRDGRRRDEWIHPGSGS